MTIASRLIDELRREPEKARSLAKLLAAEIAGDEQLRGMLLEAMLREVATRRDLAELKADLETRLDHLEDLLEKTRAELNSRIDAVNQRIDSMMRWMIGLLVTIWATLAAFLAPLLHQILAQH